MNQFLPKKVLWSCLPWVVAVKYENPVKQFWNLIQLIPNSEKWASNLRKKWAAVGAGKWHKFRGLLRKKRWSTCYCNTEGLCVAQRPPVHLSLCLILKKKVQTAEIALYPKVNLQKSSICWVLMLKSTFLKFVLIWHTIARLLHFSDQNISWLKYCVGVFYLRHDYTPSSLWSSSWQFT